MHTHTHSRRQANRRRIHTIFSFSVCRPGLVSRNRAALVWQRDEMSVYACIRENAFVTRSPADVSPNAPVMIACSMLRQTQTQAHNGQSIKVCSIVISSLLYICEADSEKCARKELFLSRSSRSLVEMGNFAFFSSAACNLLRLVAAVLPLHTIKRWRVMLFSRWNSRL